MGFRFRGDWYCKIGKYTYNSYIYIHMISNSKADKIYFTFPMDAFRRNLLLVASGFSSRSVIQIQPTGSIDGPCISRILETDRRLRFRYQIKWKNNLGLFLSNMRAIYRKKRTIFLSIALKVRLLVLTSHIDNIFYPLYIFIFILRCVWSLKFSLKDPDDALRWAKTSVVGVTGREGERSWEEAPFRPQGWIVSSGKHTALEKNDGRTFAGGGREKGRGHESAELFDEGPAGSSSTIGSDLFRDFLQTCHQWNDKWRLHPLLPAFDYLTSPFLPLCSFSPSDSLLSLSSSTPHSPLSLFLPLSCYSLASSMPLFRGSSSRMPRLPEKIDYRSSDKRGYTQSEFTRIYGVPAESVQCEGVHEFFNRDSRFRLTQRSRPSRKRYCLPSSSPTRHCVIANHNFVTVVTLRSFISIQLTY